MPGQGVPHMQYQPSPIDTTEIVLPTELLALVERLAENTHDVWAAANGRRLDLRAAPRRRRQEAPVSCALCGVAGGRKRVRPGDGDADAQGRRRAGLSHCAAGTVGAVKPCSGSMPYSRASVCERSGECHARETTTPSQPRTTRNSQGRTHAQHLANRPRLHLLDVPRHARRARPPGQSRGFPALRENNSSPTRVELTDIDLRAGRHPRAGRERAGDLPVPGADRPVPALLPLPPRSALRLDPAPPPRGRRAQVRLAHPTWRRQCHRNGGAARRPQGRPTKGPGAVLFPRPQGPGRRPPTDAHRGVHRRRRRPGKQAGRPEAASKPAAIPVPPPYPCVWSKAATKRGTGQTNSLGRLAGLEAFGRQVHDWLWEAVRTPSAAPRAAAGLRRRSLAGRSRLPRTVPGGPPPRVRRPRDAPAATARFC